MLQIYIDNRNRSINQLNAKINTLSNINFAVILTALASIITLIIAAVYNVIPLIYIGAVVTGLSVISSVTCGFLDTQAKVKLDKKEEELNEFLGKKAELENVKATTNQASKTAKAKTNQNKKKTTSTSKIGYIHSINEKE